MLMLGSKSNLTMKYSASSEQDSRFSAEKAVEVGRKWWLSQKNDEAPVYWWIAFVVEPVEIVSITFAEAYPGAEFEFFASSTNKCAKTGPVLIKGNRAEIDNKMFKNGRPYYCYGLRYTKLADSDWGYKFASLRKFDFQFKGMFQASSNSCDWFVFFPRLSLFSFALHAVFFKTAHFEAE